MVQIHLMPRQDCFGKLGQCHGCWWPGSLCSQDISSHVIDYVGEQVFHGEKFKLLMQSKCPEVIANINMHLCVFLQIIHQIIRWIWDGMLMEIETRKKVGSNCWCWVTIWSAEHVTETVMIWFITFTWGQFWPLGVVIAHICVCVCVSVCVNHLIVHVITHDSFKRGSPNLDQGCKRLNG